MDPVCGGLVDAPVAGGGGAEVGGVDSDAHVGAVGVEGLEVLCVWGGGVIYDDEEHEAA